MLTPIRSGINSGPTLRGWELSRTETNDEIEAEAALRLVVSDGQVSDVQMRIYEPPRFIEAFLRGQCLADSTPRSASKAGA